MNDLMKGDLRMCCHMKFSKDYLSPGLLRNFICFSDETNFFVREFWLALHLGVGCRSIFAICTL